MIVDYLAVGRTVLGVMPTLQCLVLERFFDETGGMQLVIHSPYGGRINRAFGIALRKKFCRTFNFELQAAATDNAIVLSLGPHHSLPARRGHALRTQRHRRRHARARDPRLADVPGPLALEPQPGVARAALPGRPQEPAADPAHGVRRPHGRDVPQRGGVPGQPGRPHRDPRPPDRAPDHRRHAARSARRRRAARAARGDGARRRARALRRHHRAVGARPRDPHRTPVRVPRRRRVPEPAGQRGEPAARPRRRPHVDRAARERRHRARARRDRRRPGRSRRAPRSPELARDHERARRVARHVRRARGAGPRASRSCTRVAELWCATETRADADLAFAGDDAAVTASGAWPPRAGRCHHCRLGSSSRRRCRRVGSRSGSPRSSTKASRCAARYTEEAVEQEREEWVARRLLARMHSYSRRARRDGVEPATVQDFMRFSLRWQHLAPGTQLTGDDGLRRAIEQLQGWEAAAVGVGVGAARPAACGATTRARSTGCATTARWAGCGSRPSPATPTRPRARRARPRRSRSCSATTCRGCSRRRAAGSDPVGAHARSHRRGRRGAPGARRVLRGGAR